MLNTDLKPIEFYEMSMQEFELYVDGYRMREGRLLNGPRKLWQLMYNANSKRSNNISDERLAEIWPLYIDPENNPKLAAQMQKQRVTEAESLRGRFHELREKIRKADEQRRNSGST